MIRIALKITCIGMAICCVWCAWRVIDDYRFWRTRHQEFVEISPVFYPNGMSLTVLERLSPTLYHYELVVPEASNLELEIDCPGCEEYWDSLPHRSGRRPPHPIKVREACLKINLYVHCVEGGLHMLAQVGATDSPIPREIQTGWRLPDRAWSYYRNPIDRGSDSKCVRVAIGRLSDLGEVQLHLRLSPQRPPTGRSTS